MPKPVSLLFARQRAKSTQNEILRRRKQNVKHAFIKRMLSFMLALVMVLGMIPVNTVHVHATETESRSVTNEDTYLELDYDKPPYKVDSNGKPVYDEKGNLIYLTPEQAMSEEAESNRTVETTYSNGMAMDYDYYWSNENTDQWRQIFKGDAKASGGNFRKWMESTDPDDQYIVLMEDMKINVGKGSDWESIVITSDKVLDLNGHTLEFYDQRNGTGDQNTGYYKHASHLFEISNDARLTVIDSGGNSITKTTSDGEIILGDGPDTGRIYSNGYMINHQKWDFWYYTHRDIFHVVSGDLVIYGGEYQAGRQKDQMKSNFSWNKLKEVIGDAVALGTAIYEYATGIEGEFAKRADILDKDMYEDLREDDNEENSKDTTKGSTGDSVKKDGKKGATEEKTTDTPASKGNADGENKKKDQTVAQKKTEDNKKKEEDKKGDKSKDNKAEEGKDAKPAKKDPENSKIAEANKAIGGAFLDTNKINAMYDTAVKFGEGLYNLFGSNEQTRATACIHGTVARVADNCTLVIYGGKFTGYGSTPQCP